MFYSTLQPNMMPLTVIFDPWIVNIGIPDILVADNENEYINEILHFSAVYIIYNSNHVRYMDRGLMDSLKTVTAN